MPAEGAGRHALLAERALGARGRPHPRDEGGDLPGRGRARDQLGHQRMLGPEAHEGDTEERVGARGEDRDGAGTALEGKADLRARAAPDPVPLHGEHALGPAGQAVQVAEQLLGVGRDAEEPLLELALDDRAVAAPAAAVHHLLVGEHGLAVRAPVDQRAALVGEAALEHAQEEELLPAVIARVAGGELALPVVREAEPAELAAHVVDVVGGPARWVDAVLDGGVLGRQPEGVPAHGVEHAPARHPPLARDHVADRVVAHVAHVDASGGVREHLEHVVRGLARLGARREGARLLPAALPLRLDRLRVVAALPLRLRHPHSGLFGFSLTPSTWAMWSSTPVPKAGESSLPKRRAISIASSMVTEAGMSARARSSKVARRSRLKSTRERRGSRLCSALAAMSASMRSRCAATPSTSSRAKTSTSPPGGPSSARALRALRSSDAPG